MRVKIRYQHHSKREEIECSFEELTGHIKLLWALFQVTDYSVEVLPLTVEVPPLMVGDPPKMWSTNLGAWIKA